jgi:ABC-2 type transport system permease protein
MKQQIKTQLYLMFTGRFFYVLCAIVIALSLTLEIASYYAAETVGVSQGSFTGFYSLISGITDFSTTEIFCVVVAALFFGTEMKNRTVNIALTAGVSRLNYWLSKWIVYLIAGFIIAVLYPLTLCIFGTVTSGFGADNLGALYFLRLFFMYFLAVVSTISMYTVFAAIFSSTSAVVFTSLGFVFMFRIVTQVIPIFVKGSEFVIGLLPSLSVSTVTNPEISFQSILTVAIIDIAVAAVLFSVSYMIFRRKELK